VGSWWTLWRAARPGGSRLSETHHGRQRPCRWWWWSAIRTVLRLVAVPQLLGKGAPANAVQPVRRRLTPTNTVDIAGAAAAAAPEPRLCRSKVAQRGQCRRPAGAASGDYPRGLRHADRYAARMPGSERPWLIVRILPIPQCRVRWQWRTHRSATATFWAGGPADQRRAWAPAGYFARRSATAIDIVELERRLGIPRPLNAHQSALGRTARGEGGWLTVVLVPARNDITAENLEHAVGAAGPTEVVQKHHGIRQTARHDGDGDRAATAQPPNGATERQCSRHLPGEGQARAHSGQPLRTRMPTLHGLRRGVAGGTAGHPDRAVGCGCLLGQGSTPVTG